MAEIKSFPSLLIGTIVSGTTLSEGYNFGRIADAMSWLLGYDLFTHEVGDRDIYKTCQDAAAAQFPEIPRNIGEDANFQATADLVLARYGETVDVARGTTERTEGPVASLQRLLGEEVPGMPIVVIVGSGK